MSRSYVKKKRDDRALTYFHHHRLTIKPISAVGSDLFFLGNWQYRPFEADGKIKGFCVHA